MAKYRLGDIAPVSKGTVPNSDQYWLLNLDVVESNTGKVLEYVYVEHSQIGASTISFDLGNVLYSKLRPYLNKVVLPDRVGYATSEMLPLRPDEQIITREYLTYFLRSLHFVEYINGKTSGAKMPRANMADIKAVEIECPSIIEQNHITAQFDLIATIIDKRQKELSTLDDLIQSRFLELFGTYPTNEMNWPIGRIKDLVTEVRYGSSRKAADGNSGKYPYLRMNNITYGGELDLTDTKTIDIPDDELDKCTVRRGDLLFNRTNSKELVGKTCVYNQDEMMVLAGFIVRVRLNSKAYPEFVSAFLNTDFSKQMLKSMCKTAIGQANINAQELQNIGIFTPPKEIQSEFISFKAQVDKSKFAIQRSLDELQLLFDSLMQQYFG